MAEKTDQVIKALTQKISNKELKFDIKPPKEDCPKLELNGVKLSEVPKYKLGDKMSTRQAYGPALISIGKTCERVIAMDGDTKTALIPKLIKSSFPTDISSALSLNRIWWESLSGVAVGAVLFLFVRHSPHSSPEPSIR